MSVGNARRVNSGCDASGIDASGIDAVVTLFRGVGTSPSVTAENVIRRHPANTDLLCISSDPKSDFIAAFDSEIAVS